MTLPPEMIEAMLAGELAAHEMCIGHNIACIESWCDGDESWLTSPEHYTRVTTINTAYEAAWSAAMAILQGAQT
jgi:hypothetical protein